MKIQEISLPEKVLLAQELWDSVLVEQSALGITPEQKWELDKRLSEFELDGELGSTWAEVKKGLLNVNDQ